MGISPQTFRFHSLRPALWAVIVGAMCSCVLTGCPKSPFLAGNQNQALQQQQTATAQLESRATDLDANNRQLHADLAQAQQRYQVAEDELKLVRNELRESAQKLNELQLARTQAEGKVQALTASTKRRAGATITANSSLRRELPVIDLPGLETTQEGDVIRIRIPADQLFPLGSYQFTATASSVLDRVADAIARRYPRQKIGIEGHTDSSPPPVNIGVNTHHQLATWQTMAVFQHLTQRNRLPSQQFFTIAHGANHPRASNATAAGAAANRRVEIVVYPDSIDDR